MAAELRKLGAAWSRAPTSSRSRRGPAWHAGGDPTTTTTASPCACRWRPSPARRCASSTRSCVGKTFPRLLRGAVRSGATSVRRPVITVDGPTASGRTHAGARLRRWATTSSIPARLPRHRADHDAHRRGERRRKPRPAARMAATLPLHFIGGDACIPGRRPTWPMPARRPPWANGVGYPPPPVRRRCATAAARSGAFPGLVADGATWAR